MQSQRIRLADDAGFGDRWMLHERAFDLEGSDQMFGRFDALRLGWLHELSINMFPEHGCLWILGTGDQETTAFTEYGVERLRETIDEEKRCGRAPKSGSATKSL